MWTWISEVVEKNAYFITHDYEKGQELASDTLMYLCENKSIAEKIYRQKSIAYLIKVMKGICNKQTVKSEFGADGTWQSQYYRDYMKMKEIGAKYNIALTEENAYKLYALCELRSVKYTQDVLQNLIKISIVPLEEEALDNMSYDLQQKVGVIDEYKLLSE